MPEKAASTSRLEAFSDGVIAVIITIMVLELKVPHEDGVAGILALLPILAIYLLSFAFTAIYWINHHLLIDRIEALDAVTLYANLIFLFFLSLLPFSTAYLLEKKVDAFAVSVYALSLCLTGFAFFLLRIAVHRLLKNAGDLTEQDRQERTKHLMSLAVYLLAVPIAYFSPRFAVGILVLITVAWIVPPLRRGFVR